MEIPKITVKAEIMAPVAKVWDLYTNADHVVNWNNASEDWHTPHAKIDLKVGGKFVYRMESTDGKQGFDFTGVYTEIVPLKLIAYTMDDGRTASINFESKHDTTEVTVTFDPETENTIELQRSGWQAILDNFKSYCEKSL